MNAALASNCGAAVEGEGDANVLAIVAGDLEAVEAKRVMRSGVVAEEATFVAVRVVPVLPAPLGAAAASPRAADPGAEPGYRIEIVLPDGTALRVSETIGATALCRVLAALRR